MCNMFVACLDTASQHTPKIVHFGVSKNILDLVEMGWMGNGSIKRLIVIIIQTIYHIIIRPRLGEGEVVKESTVELKKQSVVNGFYLL